MDPYTVALVVAPLILAVIATLGVLWERRASGPMVLLDPEQHRRAITNARYFRDVNDSTTG